MDKETYRGYDIRSYSDGQVEVIKDKQVKHTALSKADAYKWIDDQKRAERRA